MRKQLYVIADYKNPDGSVNRVRLHIKSVVAVPVLVPVPVNLRDAATLFTVTNTTIFPANPSTSVPDYHSNPVDLAPVPTTTTTTVAPALLPTATTVPSNLHTIVAPVPEPTNTTTFPSNPPTPVFPEPDTTIITRVYVNHHSQNASVPDLTPPPQKCPCT